MPAPDSIDPNLLVRLSELSVLRKVAALIFLSVLLAVAGCEKFGKDYAIKPEQSLVTVSAGAPQRFTAVRHKLEVIASVADLQKAWESVITFCGTVQCEVLSSSITTRTSESTPSGNILLRITPDDLKNLFAHVERQGKIVQHTTESEDKTIAVVDADARIKNLASFRDNLLAMLTKPSASVKDFVAIQEQLTNVQSQLDSETTQRKILANETEKVAVGITFRVERAGRSAGVFAPIGEALRESGTVLAESFAALIIVIVSVIPWLVLIVPGSWLLVRFWRKRRQKRVGFTPTGPAAP